MCAELHITDDILAMSNLTVYPSHLKQSHAITGVVMTVAKFASPKRNGNDLTRVNKERMKEALESKRFDLPKDLDRESKRQFILNSR